MKTLVFLMLSIPFLCSGQIDSSGVFQAGILAKAYEDSIVIRLVSSSSEIYEEVLSNGYILERVEYDIKSLDKIGEREILNSGDTIKMGNLIDKASLKNSEYASLGEELKDHLFSKSNLTEDDLQAEVMRQQMLALTCNVLPCRDVTIGKYLGLRFADTEVKKGSFYYYTVRLNNPSTGQEEILAVSIVNDYEPLPQPQLSSIEAGNEVLTVRWNSELLSKDYFIYDIERAREDGPFVKLNETPILPMADDRLGSVLAFYTDSVQNDVIYRYRLVGLSYFGESSPPSAPLEGMAYDVSGPNAPSLKVLSTNDKQDKVIFQWATSEEVLDLEGFVIEFSNNLKGPFIPVHDGLLNATLTNYSYDKKIEEYSNYYRICAVDKNDQMTCSFAKRLIAQDIIPPETPQGFMGSMDSLGVVHLSWEDNKDEDLWGYYVYATNDSLTEFLRVTDHPLEVAEFRDTLSINTLTKSVHYRVAAVDLRTNVSDYTKRIELFRPDIIPPSPALITVMEAKEEGNAMMWIPSPFVDMESQTLERKTKKGNWEVIESMNAFQNVYLDENVGSGIIYSYRIKSEDKAGNSSYTDKAVSIRSWKRKTYEAPSDFSAAKVNDQVTLKWAFEEADQKKIIVYRAKEKGKLTKYKTLAYMDKSEWNDSIDPNENYKYMIKIYTVDGLYSKTSNIVKTN